MAGGATERVLGVLPPIGGSFGDLARAGQLGRLLHYYLPAYLECFDRIRYFSYEPELLADHTNDAELRRKVELIAPTRPVKRRVRALTLAVGRERSLLRTCSLVRVLQAPGAVPAVLANTRYVYTYGYSYAGFTDVAVKGAARRPLTNAKRIAMNTALRVILRGATATIVTSAEGEREASGLGASKLIRIPNGVDTSLFVPRELEPVYDIAFVGQLVPRKGVAVLVEAICELPRPVSVVFVGSGPEHIEAQRQLAEPGIHASFLGTLSNDAVADVLARSRCFVLPSFAEGHPKALIEALAAGVPCIGSNIPGIRELAVGGAVALVSPGDASGLAQALAQVLQDPGVAAKLSAAGRLIAEDRFDLRRLVEREAQFLSTLAEPRPTFGE